MTRNDSQARHKHNNYYYVYDSLSSLGIIFGNQFHEFKHFTFKFANSSLLLDFTGVQLFRILIPAAKTDTKYGVQSYLLLRKILL